MNKIKLGDTYTWVNNNHTCIATSDIDILNNHLKAGHIILHDHSDITLTGLVCLIIVGALLFLLLLIGGSDILMYAIGIFLFIALINIKV